MADTSPLPLLLLRRRRLLIELRWFAGRRESEYPHYGVFEWDLRLWTDYECRSLTRFSKSEIQRLADLLHVGEIEWRNKYDPTPVMAIAVACVRMSHPRLFWEISRIFGRSRAWISSVSNDILTFLSKRFTRQIEWHPTITSRRVKHYARCLDEYGGAGQVWGFIDGTSIAICRPTIDQKLCWSGYKKKHVIKFQNIVTPDGLTISCSGPYIGEANDARLVTLSGIEIKLREVSICMSSE